MPTAAKFEVVGYNDDMQRAYYMAPTNRTEAGREYEDRAASKIDAVIEMVEVQSFGRKVLYRQER